MKKADDLREKENEWRRELDRKIRSGEATVVEGDNWQQIIVDGEVVMFVDKGRQNNEIPDDM